MTWTEERVETMRRMAGDGCTAAQIGRMIGKTRNAVIGKCGRLNIRLQASNGRALKSVTLPKRKTLGQHIRAARKAKGIRVCDFYVQTGILENTLRRYEKDRTTPHAENWRILVKVLGLDPNLLPKPPKKRGRTESGMEPATVRVNGTAAPTAGPGFRFSAELIDNGPRQARLPCDEPQPEPEPVISLADACKRGRRVRSRFEYPNPGSAVDRPLPKPAVADIETRGITLLELTERTCKYAINDGGPFLFCGRPKPLTQPYCEGHAALIERGSWRPPDPEAERRRIAAIRRAKHKNRRLTRPETDLAMEAT